MGITVFSGTAAAATALTELPNSYSIAFGFAVAVAGTIDLVLDLAGKARLHANIRSRLFGLLADLEICADSEQELKQLRRRLTQLYGEEPPTMRALDALMWNQAAMSLGLDRVPGGQLKVDWFESMLRHLWAFHTKTFQPLN